MAQYQKAGTNARLRVFAFLQAQGVPAGEADDLVAALEAGAVAGAQSEVVDLEGMAPRSRGPVFEDGWDEGVRTVSEALVGIADQDWSRSGGRSAGAAELGAHIADVRQRAGLVRLEKFVRESVLPRTYPHTTARRRVLEALGEASGLCTARTRNADGDIVICTLDAGHYDPDDKPPFKDGEPGGWHKADALIWNDLGAACIPHAAL
ncbi:hypothetical protein [Streptomyces clavuligerus]|uniref:hypothetical protein n=1 Tax=Streptomyces clavuligerus TaxID=1901 RepID=UPI001E5E302C|nr:hypothetical protein [Streptomyces clavuligerus]WDN55715.1 hypothetical protein LL058_27845 [Streptomyces clavuligerus]